MRKVNNTKRTKTIMTNRSKDKALLKKELEKNKHLTNGEFAHILNRNKA